MAEIKIEVFGGIAPRQHPTQLADGMAVTAHNVKLKTGKLVPLRKPKIVTGKEIIMENGLRQIKDAETIHVWKKNDASWNFVAFPGKTWMSEGNVADDNMSRKIVSGATGVKFVDKDGKEFVDVPALWMYDLGKKKVIRHPLVKEQLAAPIVERSGGADLDDNRRYTRFFVTWVDEYKLESPVSAPSKIIKDGVEVDEDLEYMDGDTISFQKYDTLPDGAVSIRIYKVITGTETGQVQFIKELPAITVTSSPFAVKVKDEDAGEILTEIESPPVDLKCILDVPGAFYCGFSPSFSKSVMFSEVDLIYSWPLAYRYDVKDNIVALAVSGNTVFVLTDGVPYVITGTTPESMTVTKLGGAAACIAPKGVCVYRNSAYFISNIGVMAIYANASIGTVCDNLTEKIFTKEQWQAMNPSSCVMEQYEGTLHLFFKKVNGERIGLSIDLTENSSIAVTTHDEIAKCACLDGTTGKMYFLREDV